MDVRHLLRTVLPPWLEYVRIEDLRLGTASADVVLNRPCGGQASLTVLRRGRIEVAMVS